MVGVGMYDLDRLGSMDPMTIGQILLQLAEGGDAQHRTMAEEMAEDMGITPQTLMQMQFPGSDLNRPNILTPEQLMAGPGVDLGTDLSQPLGDPSVPPGDAPVHQARVVPSSQQRWPQVRMPEQQRPVFSGGVHGAQKAPDFGIKAGLTPAQALMQAILGASQQPRQQSRGQGQSLGELLGG